MDKETINIHGKEYETVASRVSRFRAEKPNHSIVTDIIMQDDIKVIIKASIIFNGDLLATGHAEEIRKASKINQTSAVENCETSAIGRALACFGYLGTEYASADEVVKAISQQAEQPTKSAPLPKSGFNLDVAHKALDESALSAEEKANLRKQLDSKSPELQKAFYEGCVANRIRQAISPKAEMVKKSMGEEAFQDDDIPFDNQMPLI